MYLHSTPFYVNKKNAKQYSDHFACILTFKGIPTKKDNLKVSKPKTVKWNTN